MHDQTLELFRTLTEWPAAPGFERELRQYVAKRLAAVSDEVVYDRIGGVFGVRRGDPNGPRIMVAGHLDEVGFMVTAVTDNGMLKFQTLGGWWNQTLLAQRVQVVTTKGALPGVIASIPPHLLKDSQRNAPLEVEQMLIDIGADSREEAEQMGVRPGVQVVPVCPFTPLAGGKKIMAKAWDNRYGVGLAIELLEALQQEQAELPNVLYAGATVQEELGLRGAEPAARLIEPDLAFVLDASPANDMSGDRKAFGQLGAGALLRIMDRTMVTRGEMIDFVRDTAETHRIPYQYYVSPGGTDAGRIHLSGIGVPTAVIGICARYIHTAASIIHVDDYAAAKELLLRLVKAADRSTLSTIIGEISE
ncbi:M42 family peptidase [Xylanibacillus composti]|uniref:Peptidase M28 n=1 Tax=Xylanibacillus composti TaxID=1572762 RepID=A0A8J4H2F7_9BACL|nr:M42 family metallopeptidase [Xylanibacillus composti]MDT9724936.1 M42 family peptidase [Xylanibacillus composti]GIQ68172.1 peptidase M28 [Xylanibacillus composti]